MAEDAASKRLAARMDKTDKMLGEHDPWLAQIDARIARQAERGAKIERDKAARAAHKVPDLDEFMSRDYEDATKFSESMGPRKGLVRKKGETDKQFMQRSWASQSRKKVNRSLSRGVVIDIENIAELSAALSAVGENLDDAVNAIMRGPWGKELLEQVEAELSDHRDSGHTVKHLGIWQRGRQVHVGHDENAAREKHPKHSRANIASIMRWLESGTRMHYIPTRVAPDNRVAIRGRVYSRVAHPGQKAYRPMKRSLRVFAAEGERLVLEEIGRRLENAARAVGVPVTKGT